jgi:predicted acetyltransferase
VEYKIELLEKKDIRQFRKLVNHAFPMDFPFERTWPHICLDKNERGLKHLGIRDKGKVVSHVGFIPVKMKLPGAALNIAGIGAVATYEKYRGKGFMKLQLNYAERLMNAGDFDISWLGGDRKRYGYFGWENGGRLMEYCITERTTQSISVSGFNYKKYSGKPEDIEEIKSIHERDKIGLKRTMADYKLYFGRSGRDTIIACSGKKPVAYINFMKNKKEEDTGDINEFGGNLEALKALFRHVIIVNKYMKIKVYAPPFYSRYSDLLVSLSGSWMLHFLNGMIKIINLKSTLKKFTGQMSSKIKGLQLKNVLVTLEIPELNQKVTLAIGKVVKIVNNDKDVKRKISLSRKDMVRFLFGISRPSDEFCLEREYSVLDVIFPLDIYWWHLEVI